jgi:hypothetical protein
MALNVTRKVWRTAHKQTVILYTTVSKSTLSLFNFSSLPSTSYWFTQESLFLLVNLPLKSNPSKCPNSSLFSLCLSVHSGPWLSLPSPFICTSSFHSWLILPSWRWQQVPPLTSAPTYPTEGVTHQTTVVSTCLSYSVNEELRYLTIFELKFIFHKAL